ncbi:class I SAM-dependent methyltransferase [Polynucleobacter asymbioticus]|nr:class I SAM-dependent methyltransferase [Polynucleobacter asymbioticus]
MSKHGKNIFCCSNTLCEHFFTPMLEGDQGICHRPDNIEQESNAFLAEFNERNSLLLDLFRTFIPEVKKPIKLLDFGAGNAHISRTFKNILKNDVVIYCLEPNPLCTDFYERYELIQVKNINAIPEKINLIYMIEVIEHLENPILVLKDLIGALEPNGKIFISTPVGAMDENSTNAYDTASHLHFFTEKSLNLTLSKAGLTQIAYKHYPEMYPIPKFSSKSLIVNFIRILINAFKFNKHQQVANNGSKSKKIGHLVGVTEVKP